ncbi:MAG: hypothetical protein R3255_10950 [Candidatus Lokiarchaeia archaeon]|nr:hypothetical protein [Candidatus Lokiarchaeia archaeon]
MKSKGILVVILSIALILSVTLILVGPVLSKPKPNPNSNPELIIFEGDLEGNQEVVGCCPNAGPWPEYTMTLSDNFQPEFRGEHIGNIFMNGFGQKLPWEYKVQFWWTEDDTEYFIEIRGGEVQRDRKTKILTVTFVMVETYEIWIGYELQDNVIVTFTLTRDPHHPATK